MIYQGIVNIAAVDSFDSVKYLTDYISGERKNRIGKFFRDRDKIRSLVAELLLKHMIGTIYDMDMTRFKFGVEKYGKPYLIDSGLKFNISHSGDYVVCAVGDSETGVDVEKIGKTELPEIYSVFSSSEIIMVKELPPDMQADMFYRIWTLKESYVKKTGDGLHRSFDSFSFELSGKRICMKENDKVDCENAFFNKKLDSRYWYSVCFPSCEQLSDIAEYDVSGIIRTVREFN